MAASSFTAARILGRTAASSYPSTAAGGDASWSYPPTTSKGFPMLYINSSLGPGLFVGNSSSTDDKFLAPVTPRSSGVLLPREAPPTSSPRTRVFRWCTSTGTLPPNKISWGAKIDIRSGFLFGCNGKAVSLKPEHIRDEKVKSDYICSLSRCNRWTAQGGRSNAYFAKTLDDRFVIKLCGTVNALANYEDEEEFLPLACLDSLGIAERSEFSTCKYLVI